MKAALAERKAKGARLGNIRNLPDAQRKGAMANKRAAIFRARELETLFAEAKRLAARTVPEIAAKLNELGERTAQGKAWTPGNFYQARRKKKARKASAGPTPAAIAPPRPSIYDGDGRLTEDGLRRFNAAMAIKRYKPRTSGKLMRDMRFNPYDVSICPGLHYGAPMKMVFREPLQKWIEKVEASGGGP